jgi:DNA-binding SARP family transcriptional activator
LFGKFTALADGQPLGDFGSGKAQELLAYLLVHRDRPHSRESLAEMLWEASSSTSAKKYLRQALWQMQQALPGGKWIENETDWVRISRQANLRLDVAEFEQAFARAHGIPGQDLDAEVAAGLERAAALYRGDLLEGWYADWCIFERERLQNTWLAVLDKLMGYCEIRQDYEAGQAYGMQVLRSDRARERTHRQLMRMAYLAGDRTGALRQYERCARALQEELGVRPGRRTEQLYRQMLNDEAVIAPGAQIEKPIPAGSGRIGHLRGILAQLRSNINDDLDALEQALTDAESS